MTETNVVLAEAYYQAMNNKDLPGMARYFHPDIEFCGPLAEIRGKDAVLEGAKRLFPFFKSLTIRAKFSSANQVMLAYDLNCSAPMGVLRVAALLTFEKSLIARIELFFDARPFEMKKG